MYHLARRPARGHRQHSYSVCGGRAARVWPAAPSRSEHARRPRPSAPRAARAARAALEPAAAEVCGSSASRLPSPHRVSGLAGSTQNRSAHGLSTCHTRLQPKVHAVANPCYMRLQPLSHVTAAPVE